MAAVVAAGLAAYLCFAPGRKPADFSFVLLSEQKSLDPAINTTLAGGRVIRALFEGLAGLNPRTLAPEPALARSWEISPDRLHYTFFLRPARWSNGTPVSAHDFVYSWKRLLDPLSTAEYDYMLFYLKNGARFRKGQLADFDSVGVHAQNDSTLIVDLEHPTPYFLDIAAFESLFPVNRACVEKYRTLWTRPENIVCNGPYTLTFHQLNHKLRLEKNPAYWNRARVRLAIVDAYTCEGINTAFNMYETGVADLIDDFPSAIADTLLKRKDAMVAPYLGTYLYRCNMATPPLDNPLVRRSLEMAVNKEEIVRHITKGGEVAATSFVPPGLPGYPTLTGVLYNPDSARSLLAQAGFPKGKGFPPLQLLYNTSENHKKIAEAVCYMLRKELAISLDPVNVEWSVLQEKMRTRDYQIIRGSWIGDYTDPNTFLDMFVTNGGNNQTGWSNSAYDSLIALAGQTLNPAQRMDRLAAAEKILVAEGPLINVYFYVTKFLIKPRIKGVYPNIRGYFNIADMYTE